MSILIFVVIVVVLLALGIYAVDLMPILNGTLKGLIKVLLVVVAIVVIVQRFGLWR